MSRGLGQTELLMAPQPKRLIVRPGYTAYWGVDPSSVRVAIASVSGDGERNVAVVPFSAAPALPRLAATYAATWNAAGDLIAAGLRPGVVAVEQPSGKTPNPTLLYATGAILAALAARVQPAQLTMVPSATWKAVACGRGNLYKPKPPCDPFDYAVLRWAREHGYGGTSWDAADAWGVAEWAHRTFRLEER